MYPCITTYWLNQPIIFIVIASYIVNVVNINYFNAYIWSEYIQVTINRVETINLFNSTLSDTFHFQIK